MSNDTNNGGPAFPGQWYDFQPLTGEQVVREVVREVAQFDRVDGCLDAEPRELCDRRGREPVGAHPRRRGVRQPRRDDGDAAALRPGGHRAPPVAAAPNAAPAGAGTSW